MDHANRKIVILITPTNDIDAGVELLRANGYEVELRPQRDREVVFTNSAEQKSRAEQLVDKTRQLLTSNLACKISLDCIARQVGSNRSQLASAFKSILGKGVFEWLREQKLKQAKVLLLQTEMPIQSIAFDIGFDNQANFSSAYKKHFGISPREQRLMAHTPISNHKNTHLQLSLTQSKVTG